MSFSSAPNLPRGILPSSLEGVVEELSPNGNVRSTVWSAMLAGMSLSISGQGSYVRPDGHGQSCAVYGVAITPPNTGKTFLTDTLVKNPVREGINAYLQENQRTLINASVTRDAWEKRLKKIDKAIESAASDKEIEELIAKKTDLLMQEPPATRKPTFIVTGGTMGGIFDALVQSSVVGHIAVEGAAFTSGMREGHENRMAEMWDGSSIHDLKVASKSSVEAPRLTVLWMFQNERWASYIGGKRGARAIGSGLINRELITCNDVGTIKDKGVIGEATLRYCGRVKGNMQRMLDVVLRGHAETLYRFSHKADAVLSSLERHYSILESDAGYRPFSEYIGRSMDNIRRIATILHVFGGGEGEIYAEHAECAAELMRFHLDTFIYLFEKQQPVSRREEDARTLYLWLRSNRKLPDGERKHVAESLGMDAGRLDRAISTLFENDVVEHEQINRKVCVVLRRDAAWAVDCLVPEHVSRRLYGRY